VDRDASVAVALVLRLAAVMVPDARTEDAVMSVAVRVAVRERPADVIAALTARPDVPITAPDTDATPLAVNDALVIEPAVENELATTAPAAFRPDDPICAATALTVPEAVREPTEADTADREDAVTPAEAVIPLEPATIALALTVPLVVRCWLETSPAAATAFAVTVPAVLMPVEPAVNAPTLTPTADSD